MYAFRSGEHYGGWNLQSAAIGIIRNTFGDLKRLPLPEGVQNRYIATHAIKVSTRLPNFPITAMRIEET
jgi:hypothetical protein